jgi:hypothetical protein
MHVRKYYIKTPLCNDHTLIKVTTGCPWLSPVILATQEAEIRRIVVQDQFRQIVRGTLSHKNPTQKGLVEWLKCPCLASVRA